MKVIISGGIKSENIVKGISERFTSGGVDFLTVPFIEDIDSIYQRGEYFDKAIILEQSWNHDFEDDGDETLIRTRINNFANESANRGLENVSYVFLTQDYDSASKIYEEILPIQQSSVILVKEPKYKVAFFASLVKTEIDKFPSELVYKPEIEEETPIQETEIEVQEHQPTYEADYDNDDISKVIFDEDEEYNANRLTKKEEIDFNGFEDGAPEDLFGPTEDGLEPDNVIDDGGFDSPSLFGDEPTIEDDKSFESGDINDSNFNPDFDDGFGGFPVEEQATGFEGDTGFGDIETFVPESDEDIQIIDDTEPKEFYPKSGELPDYSGPDSGYSYQQQEENIKPSRIDLEKQPEQPLFDDGLYNEPSQDYYPDEQLEEQEEYNPDLDNLNNNNQQFTNGFNDADYDGEPDIIAPTQRQYQRVDMSNDQIKATLDAFANRGNSILLTGCGGCGTSTIALNLANIINNLGYTVLLVDLDTENKAQSYISKDNYECVEPDSAGLMAAINSTSGINAHISIVRQGFHLLTMGMSSDSAQIDKIIHKEKISRFINLAKTSHNFVIYDVPFRTAVGFGSDFTFMADNVVVTIDCSNWGITKTMLNMCNIENDDMQETLFNRGQLLFNRYRILNKVMGRKVKTAMDITKVMDFKVRELLGEDPGYYFQSMHICGLLNEDPNFEAGWFESTQYSDTDMGSKLFLDMLKNIVLKR